MFFKIVSIYFWNFLNSTILISFFIKIYNLLLFGAFMQLHRQKYAIASFFVCNCINDPHFSISARHTLPRDKYRVYAQIPNQTPGIPGLKKHTSPFPDHLQRALFLIIVAVDGIECKDVSPFYKSALIYTPYNNPTSFRVFRSHRITGNGQNLR